MTITPEGFKTMLRAVAAAIERDKDRLSELDGVIGDGDHGVTMSIGWTAIGRALDTLDPAASITDIANAAAKAFLNAVGASAGPLYATAFMRGAAAVKGAAALDRDLLGKFLEAALQGIRDRGKAEPGDKTMLDAWIPAIDNYQRARQNGEGLPQCLAAAARGAEDGMNATRDMVAAKGRASRLGERSRGHIDPGAASTQLIFRTLAEASGTADAA